MPGPVRNGRRLVAVVLAVALVGAVVSWLVLRTVGGDDAGAAVGAAVPVCADLPETELGPFGEDPAWNGCLTDDGAAVRSYRYECSGLRESLAPRGERELADEAAVVFLPDAGLMAATGQPWVEVRNARQAYLRTPFAMLVTYRCDELRSLRHEGMEPGACDLDDVPLDLHTTQGCSQDDRQYAAVGRTCGYVDFDITVVWEQWSIDVPEVPGVDDDLVLESGPDEQWWMVPERHRDERCSTPPDEWDPAWR
jgi:hypothetical protein